MILLNEVTGISRTIYPDLNNPTALIDGDFAVKQGDTIRISMDFTDTNPSASLGDYVLDLNGVTAQRNFTATAVTASTCEFDDPGMQVRPGLTDGGVNIGIRILDNLGNETETNIRITVDNTTPMVTSILPQYYFTSTGTLVEGGSGWNSAYDIPVFSGFLITFDSLVTIDDSVGFIFMHDFRLPYQTISSEVEAYNDDDNDGFATQWLVKGDRWDGTLCETHFPPYFPAGIAYLDGNMYYEIDLNWGGGSSASPQISDYAGNTLYFNTDEDAVSFHTEFTHPSTTAYIVNSGIKTNITNGTTSYFPPNINLRLQFSEQVDPLSLANNLFITAYNQISNNGIFIPLTTDETRVGDLDGDGFDDATLDNFFMLEDATNPGRHILELDFSDDLFVIAGTYSVRLAGLISQAVGSLSTDPQAGLNSFGTMGACNLAAQKFFTETYTFNIFKDIPHIISTNPRNLETGVGVTDEIGITQEIIVYFDTRLNTVSVQAAGSIRLYKGSTELPGRVTYRYAPGAIPSPYQAVFTSYSHLAYNSQYTVVVSNAIKSHWGTPISFDQSSEYSFSFTTMPASYQAGNNLSPSLTDYYPPEFAFNLDTSILLYFTEALDASSVNSSNIQFTSATSGGAINAVYSYHDKYGATGQYVVVIDPVATLSPNNRYRVYLPGGGVKDLNGAGFDNNPLTAQSDSFSYIFTTANQVLPEVTTVTPVNITSNARQDVAVKLLFNKVMNTATVQNAFSLISETGEVIAGAFTWKLGTSTSEVTFTPSNVLALNISYVVLLNRNAQDSTGNRMEENFTSSFKVTQAAAGVSSGYPFPRVMSTMPVDGATDVSDTLTAIKVVFSNTMEVDTLNTTLVAGSVLLKDSLGDNITVQVDYPLGTQTKEVTVEILTTPLVKGELYTMTIHEFAEDIFGKRLDGNSNGTHEGSIDKYTMSFTTAIDTSTAGTGVSHTIPADGSTGVDPLVQIRVFFNDTETSHSLRLFNAGTGSEISGSAVFVSAFHMLIFSLRSGTSLEYNTQYYFTVDNGSKQYYFTVKTDNDPPKVHTLSPAASSTTAAITAEINIVFNEDMDSSSINSNTIVVSAGDRKISGTVSYVNASRKAVFQPSPTLVNGIDYRVVVKSACKDKAGNSMGTDYNYTFTTVDDTAGYILEAFPLPGEESSVMVFLKKPGLQPGGIIEAWQEGMTSMSTPATTELIIDGKSVIQGNYHLSTAYPGLGIIRAKGSEPFSASLYFSYNLSQFDNSVLSSPDRTAQLVFNPVKGTASWCFESKIRALAFSGSQAPATNELSPAGSNYSFHFQGSNGVINIKCDSPERKGIYFLENGMWKYVGCDFLNGYFTAPAAASGSYALFSDIRPPRLSGEPESVYEQEIRELRFKVEEFGSGLDLSASSAMLNNKSCNLRLDASTGDLVVNLGGALTDGDYNLALTAIDRAGNKQDYSPRGFAVALPFTISYFRIYPNPAVDFLAVDFQLSSVADSSKLTVYDTSGRKVKTYHFNASQYAGDLELISSRGRQLANGVYFYRFETVKGSMKLQQSGKFSVVR
ncbi:MAG: Ig-like domain-containing protein [Candidatus Wallbacteria bacterium]|nr:Ig-like domain-containing protein [Candidatus Wallbacteria bacterium]